MRNIVTLCLSLLSLGLFAETQQEVELSLPNDSIIVLGNDTIKIDKDQVFRVKTPQLIVTKIKDEANKSASKIQVLSNGESIFSTTGAIRNDVEVSTSHVKPGIAIEDTLVISWKDLEWTIVTELEPEEIIPDLLPNNGKLELQDSLLKIGDLWLKMDSSEKVFFWPKDNNAYTVTGVVMPEKLDKKSRLTITLNGDVKCDFDLRYSDELKNPFDVCPTDTMIISWNRLTWKVVPTKEGFPLWLFLVIGISLLAIGFAFWWFLFKNKKAKEETSVCHKVQNVSIESNGIRIEYSTAKIIKEGIPTAKITKCTDNQVFYSLNVIQKTDSNNLFEFSHPGQVESGSYNLKVSYDGVEEKSVIIIAEKEVYSAIEPKNTPSDCDKAFHKLCEQLCPEENIEAICAKINYDNDFSSFISKTNEESTTQTIDPDTLRIDNLINHLGGNKVEIRTRLLEYNTAKDVLDDYVEKEVESLIKRNTKAKEIYERVNKDFEKFIKKIDELLRSNGNTGSLSSATFDELWEGLYNVNNRARFNIKIFEEIKKKAQDKSIALGNFFDIEGFLKDYEDLRKQLQTMSSEEKMSDIEIIRRINSNELPNNVASSFFGKLRDELNAILIDERKIKVDNMAELLKIAAESINAPKSDADVKAIATAMAEESIEKIKNESDATITKIKQESETKVTEANNRANCAEQSAQSSKDKLEQKTQEYKNDIEAEKQKADQRVQATIDEYEQKLAEQKQQLEHQKAESETRLNKTIDEISNTLSAEKDAHAADVVKLQDFLAAYIDMIKQTFEVVNNSIKIAYNGPDKSVPLAQMVSKKIVKNNVFSFEDFEDSLNGVLQSSTGKSVAEVKDSLRTVFVNCLSEEMPTWIDVLARLHSYTKVPFIAEQFIKQGLDLSCVATAFQFTKSLLGILDIEITYPELFVDKFNRDDYEAKALRNIESYVEDINSHVTEENIIIDLHTVGFKVNGEIQELPVVSKF